jgi:hypothetical protein
VSGWGSVGDRANASASDPPLRLKLINQAHAALAEDHELAAFLLGVEVEDRVLTLYGKLPNAELRRRAADILKKLPEIRDVRNEITINPEQKPFVQAGSPSRYRSQEPAPPPTQPAGTLTKGTPNREPMQLTWQYAPGEGPQEDRKQAADTGATVRATELSLDQAIRVIRLGDKRFAGLRHELRGRVVYLNGEVATWDDVMALARIVSRLPGVERVVLTQVHTPHSD